MVLLDCMDLVNFFRKVIDKNEPFVQVVAKVAGTETDEHITGKLYKIIKTG